MSEISEIWTGNRRAISVALTNFIIKHIIGPVAIFEISVYRTQITCEFVVHTGCRSRQAANMKTQETGQNTEKPVYQPVGNMIRNRGTPQGPRQRPQASVRLRSPVAERLITII